MHQAIRAHGEREATALVPIPLSLDKAEAGEFHRTRALARELGRLLGLPVVEALSLDRPISKRRLQAGGVTSAHFERRYSAALQVDPAVRRHRRVILVDDVSTHGSTLGCAARALSQHGVSVALATAGQMVTAAAVRDETAVLR
jgi:predicted amidophosphoribosyltransferase